MKDVPEDNINKLELCYKATKDTLKAIGLFPSPTYAHSLTNIYNDNRQQESTVISANVMKLIGDGISRQLQEIEDEEVT